MNDEEFKAILGDAFDELNAKGNELIESIEGISVERMERIRNTSFQINVPMTGQYALDLAESLIHAEDDGCIDCLEYLADFVSAFIYTTWKRIMEEVE